MLKILQCFNNILIINAYENHDALAVLKAE